MVGRCALAELYATKQLPKPSKIIVIMGIALLATGTIAQLQGAHLVMVKRFLFGGFYVLLVWWLLTHQLFKPSECSLVSKCLLHLGKISFSLYLIHYPLLQVCGLEWEKQFGSKPDNFLIPLAFCFITILIANVFYLIVEKPCHLLARRLFTANQKGCQ